MDAESIFSFVFVGFVAFIPFSLAYSLGKEIFNHYERLPALISRVKETKARVVGYTLGYPSDSSGDYYAVVEFKTENGDVIWAENSAQKNKDYAIEKEVLISYHPDDPRHVTIGDYRHLMKGGKIMLYIVAAFSLIVSLSLLFYFKFPSMMSYLITGGYLSGFILGYRFGTNADLKNEKAMRKTRDERLIAAQQEGKVPCNLSVRG